MIDVIDNIVNKIIDNATLDGRWTGWQEKFAWLPKKLYSYESHELDGITISYQSDKHRWVWLRRYYERKRLDMIWNPTFPNGRSQIEYDHALDLFELMSKT